VAGRQHFYQLNATFAASHTQAWAVGQTRVAASGDGFETLIEEWNGSTWSVVPGAPASVSASFLNGVSGTGPSDIWAVGQNAGTSFIEHWNGQSWSHVASPASEPPDGQLNAVSADSPTDAWAGGSATNANDTVVPLIEQPGQGAPVDDQVLTRRPHRRAAAPVMVPPPHPLLLRDQPAEVPRRPGIPRRAGSWQQPLGRDPPRCLLHAFRDQDGDAVVVTGPRRPLRRGTAGLVPGDHPPHGLVRSPRDRGGPAVSACLSVGGDDIHTFPRRLQ
jgi:hypothetical protein